MCHAMNQRGIPCRRKGPWTKATVTTMEPISETFETGFCSLHYRQLQNTGHIILWRPHFTSIGFVSQHARLEGHVYGTRRD